jgi:hypothetical protein
MTFWSGPNSEGTRVLVETPDPFGPRKRDHASGSGASAAALATLRASNKTGVVIISG